LLGLKQLGNEKTRVPREEVKGGFGHLLTHVCCFGLGRAASVLTVLTAFQTCELAEKAFSSRKRGRDVLWAVGDGKVVRRGGKKEWRLRQERELVWRLSLPVGDHIKHGTKSSG